MKETKNKPSMIIYDTLSEANQNARENNIDDMIKGDVIFCATAITNGDLANGIKDQKEFYEASTIALHKEGKVNTLFKNKHKK